MFFVYINLKHRDEKNEHKIKLLKLLRVEFERFEAIKPDINDSICCSDRITNRIRGYLSNEIKIPRGIGVIGCYLSHLNVLKKYKNIKNKYLCVLEDDVLFTNKSLKRINNVIEYLDSQKLDWDMLRSLWTQAVPNEGICEIILKDIELYKFNLPNIQSVYNKGNKCHTICGGTHFQIINMKNIEKIINYMEREYIYNIDSIYSTNELNVYVCTDNFLDVSLPVYLQNSDIPKL
jgi:GR25 family glycosyltransferase involved in LPS biosynthesis